MINIKLMLKSARDPLLALPRWSQLKFSVATFSCLSWRLVPNYSYRIHNNKAIGDFSGIQEVFSAHVRTARVYFP